MLRGGTGFAGLAVLAAWNIEAPITDMGRASRSYTILR